MISGERLEDLRADHQVMIAAGVEPPGLAEYCQEAEANLAERRR